MTPRRRPSPVREILLVSAAESRSLAKTCSVGTKPARPEHLQTQPLIGRKAVMHVLVPKLDVI